jgi:Flp pilus assembly protein TadD
MTSGAEKDDSIAAMRQVLRFEPDKRKRAQLFGVHLYRYGVNLDEAEQLIRKALDQKPGDGYITDSLAWVYYKRGQYDKALPILEQAASLVPDDPIVRSIWGMSTASSA